MSSQDGVQFMRIAADDVAHFNPDVIKEIRGRLGPALARQELDAEFVASASSVFDASALDAMFAPDVDLKVEGSDIPAQETALEQRFRRLQQDEDNDKRRSMGWPRI